MYFTVNLFIFHPFGFDAYILTKLKLNGLKGSFV